MQEKSDIFEGCPFTIMKHKKTPTKSYDLAGEERFIKKVSSIQHRYYLSGSESKYPDKR